MDQHTLLVAAVPVTGFAAGFINTLAGSGSLLTRPILILLGLPATLPTTRIASACCSKRRRERRRGFALASFAGVG